MAKRTKLSLSFKVDVIKKFEENPSATKKSLADHFKIPESTLKGILKKRDEILTAERECGNQSSKRSRIQGGKFQKLEMMSDDDDDNEENDAKIPPNHTKALEALDTIRDYLQFNATTETPFSHLYELEKIVSVIHLQKHKQSSIMDYFERK